MKAITKMLILPTHSFFEGVDSPTPTPTPTVTPTPTPTEFKPITSQADLDRIMGEQRRNLQQKNKDLADELERRKNASSTTEQEKTELQTRIDQLNNEFTTTTELKDRRIKELETKYEKDTKKFIENAKTWEDRYSNLLITNDLLQAASNPEYKAFNPQQVVDLLKHKAYKQETTGDDGKPNGQFITKVKFTGEKDGKPVELNLTPVEVLKLMTEMPKQYGNLFNSNASSGPGDFNINNNGNNLPKLGPSVSMEDYVKNRESYLRSTTTTNG